VVDDAGTALPVVVEQIKSSGTDVDSAREVRLSFDDVFAILVKQHETETAARSAAGGKDDDPRRRDGSEAA
jgi:hypothetical protein